MHECTVPASSLTLILHFLLIILCEPSDLRNEQLPISLIAYFRKHLDAATTFGSGKWAALPKSGNSPRLSGGRSAFIRGSSVFSFLLHLTWDDDLAASMKVFAVR